MESSHSSFCVPIEGENEDLKSQLKSITNITEDNSDFGSCHDSSQVPTTTCGGGRRTIDCTQSCPICWDSFKVGEKVCWSKNVSCW